MYKAKAPATSAALPCPPVPSFTFTQGVLIGQASMQTATFGKRHRRLSSTAATASHDFDILKQLSYDLSNLPFESSRWLNVILGQIITSYRDLILSSSKEEGGAKGFVERAVNARLGDDENPSYVCLDHVDVKEVDFGSSFPVCSNIRIRPRDDTGSLRIDMDIDYADNASLSIDTKVLVNFPRPKFAILPVSLSLSIVKFSATVSLEIQPDLATGAPSLCASLQPDFSLELTSSSLIGARAKLQDIPKVEQLIAGRLRGFIIDKMVWPHKLAVKLPDIGHATETVQEEFILIDRDAAMDEDDGPHPAEADSDPTVDELLGPAVRPLRPTSLRPLSERPSFAAQPRLSPLLSSGFDSFQRYAPSADSNDAPATFPGHLPSLGDYQHPSAAMRYRQRPMSQSSLYSS